ncbi:FAD-dependent oxidoreductase [Amycolatopsis suaedae]|uniref:FAD-dependent oxidoreductase n=1 Tax=Amycolatopsis suaedae TaxID=2510978 RepID=A0A4Q7JDX4_9PSEU|nr:FAD-dependent oxidoreductase [Amycolatopsis suaedae]RZQ65637.1 FAD-dependent oxidoreductase [Amycolatopsis suaedae]
MTAADFRGRLIEGTDWFGHDFTGQRVAVVAPGREAAQIVPEVAATALSVKVFQEEPDWVLPLPVPGPRAVGVLVARIFLRQQVKDPWIRRLLTPGRFGSRRLATGPGYYGALRRPHCTLVTWPVYAFTAGGVRTAEGVEHRVDCVVLGPGSVFAGTPEGQLT